MTRSRPTSVLPPEPPTALTRRRSEVSEQLNRRIQRGQDILKMQLNTHVDFDMTGTEILKWRDYNLDLLKQLFTTKVPYAEYRSACNPSRLARDEYDATKVQLETIPRQISKLKSILERLELYPEPGDSARPAREKILAPDQSKIFVVHGHDEGMRESVARFVQGLGFEPIILNERANQGRTVIEKIEDNGDVGFAIVLLSPDDEGRANGGVLAPRARQNVLLELGYFLGRLGRRQACALKRGEIEIPSDFGGVVYEPFDASGGWKHALGRELKEAGYPIDWNKVMK